MEDATYALVRRAIGTRDGEGPWRTRAHSQPQRCIEEIDLSLVS